MWLDDPIGGQWTEWTTCREMHFAPLETHHESLSEMPVGAQFGHEGRAFVHIFMVRKGRLLCNCEMTGISRKAISSIIADIQQAMLTECLEHPPTMGGPGKIVEIDETEVGVRRKGVKGRPANIK